MHPYGIVLGVCIIKDEIKMVKGHYAYITRMYKPLALMTLTTITKSKNSYILGSTLFCSNTDKMLVVKFPTMPCVYMTTKKKKYFTGENFCGLAMTNDNS